MTQDPYSNLKAIPGEAVYTDWDDDFDCWAVFGEESGFCYGQYDEPWKAIGRKERIDHLNKKD